MALRPRTEYTIQVRMPVICATCNEDMGRAQTGVEATTIAEARDQIREHNEDSHPGTIANIRTER